ncbi:MAG: hypothetical protein AB1765_07175 [Candidatus Hydrogenedentota bacterium]
MKDNMNKTIIAIIIGIILITADIGVVINCHSRESEESSEPATSQIKKTSGTYMGHNWHIDENHLMWWDGKPYVPYINPSPILPGEKRDRFCRVGDLHPTIDYLHQHGIRDMMLETAWSPEDVNEFATHLTNKGMTYLFSIGGLDLLLLDKKYNITKEDRFAYTILYSTTPGSASYNLKLGVPFISDYGFGSGDSPGVQLDEVKAYIFDYSEGEYDSLEQEEKIAQLQKEFFLYILGKGAGEFSAMIKWIFGDVPTLIEAWAAYDLIFNEPALKYGVDALSVTYNGNFEVDDPMINFNTRGDFANALRVLDRVQNESGKTKLYWSIQTFGIGPFKTKDEMKRFYMKLADVGVKGFQYLNENNYGWYKRHPEIDMPSHQQERFKWFSELRDEIIQAVIEEGSKK